MSATTTTTTTTGTINAKVFRYNPSVDSAPYYKTYQVPWRQYITVLEVLRYIHENIEPISFDYSCRGTLCGMCCVRVNEVPMLACGTALQPGNVTIEPMAGMRVIKDLIVDKTPAENRVNGNSPWFSRPQGPMTVPLAMDPAVYLRVAAFDNCISCQACQSVCPVLTPGNPNYKGPEAFAGPYVLTKLAIRYFDTRENNSDSRLQTAVSQGLFNCILDGLCDSVCPSGNLILTPGYENASINHVQAFKDMMAAAQAKGLGPPTTTTTSTTSTTTTTP